jgi:hypothetical protein
MKIDCTVVLKGMHPGWLIVDFVWLHAHDSGGACSSDWIFLY